jgi:hypothetical protein
MSVKYASGVVLPTVSRTLSGSSQQSGDFERRAFYPVRDSACYVACAKLTVPGPMPPRLIIIAGGQSGVDRAALDIAIARGIPYGGWCPKGGWAEDFPDPPGVLTRYPLLQETPSAAPAQRTEWNVRDSDASLILVDAGGVAVSGGTALAAQFSAQYAKPLLAVDVGAADAGEHATTWLAALLATHRSDAPFRLAIGGPRESEAPGVYEQAREVLSEVVEKLVGWVRRAAP